MWYSRINSFNLNTINKKSWWIQSWNNRQVQNWQSNISRLYNVTCLFNFYTEYITWIARVDESQAGIKVSRKNINNLRYADDTTVMAESEEEPKQPLDEGERG